MGGTPGLGELWGGRASVETPSPTADQPLLPEDLLPSPSRGRWEGSQATPPPLCFGS